MFSSVYSRMVRVLGHLRRGLNFGVKCEQLIYMYYLKSRGKHTVTVIKRINF